MSIMKVTMARPQNIGHRSKITKKNFDTGWLMNIARDAETRENVEKIKRWNHEVQEGRFQDSEELLALHLGEHQIWLRVSDAWFALHLYGHMFQDKEHMNFDGFDGNKASLVLDLGANIGLYTLAIKTNNPECQVFALEPNPRAFELLEKNMTANGIEGVTTLNVGAAEFSGEMLMRVLDEGTAFGGKYLGEIKKEYRTWVKPERLKTMTVPALSLVDIFRINDIGDVDILKMDVEGMEHEVLRSSAELFPRIRRIVVEWHDHASKNELVQMLCENGFSLVYEDEREYGDIYFMNDRYA